jgi:hypothetical protein
MLNWQLTHVNKQAKPQADTVVIRGLTLPSMCGWANLRKRAKRSLICP